jgi:hypothetical protein
MGAWYECLHLKSLNVTFTAQCAAQRIHMDLGLFGYYPLIDRAKGLYFQIAQAVIVGLNDTNPGCSGAMQLRSLVKPAVDRALGHAGSSEAFPQPRIGVRTGLPDVPDRMWSELAIALEGLQSETLVEEEAAADEEAKADSTTGGQGSRALPTHTRTQQWAEWLRLLLWRA